MAAVMKTAPEPKRRGCRIQLPRVTSTALRAGFRRLAGRSGSRRNQRALPFCIEIAPFDGRDLGALKHIRIHVVSIDADTATAFADPFKNLVFFEDVVFLSLALDDRDLVVDIIPVGNRRRMRGGETADQNRRWNHRSSEEPTDKVPGHEAGNSYFFFFAAGFLAAFFAAGFFAALAMIFVLQFLHRAFARLYLPDSTSRRLQCGENQNALQTDFSADHYRNFR